MKINTEKLPKSEIKISIEMPWADFEKYKDKALKKVQNVVEIDGFRKGHAPVSEIEKKYGKIVILEEMVNIALDEVYPKVIEENKILPITSPSVTVKKLAEGNPFEADILVATYPEINLPDYKKIAKEAGNTPVKEVTDKEVEDVIEELRKKRKTNGGPQLHTHDHNEPHDHDHNHDHTHDHEHKHDEKENDAQNDLPEINDEFAKSFGPEIKSVDDLKKKIKENLVYEKKHEASEKKRVEVMNKLLSETKTDLNDALIEIELTRMIGQMQSDISRFGGTWEDYLKHANKTEDELKKDWRKDAERRALGQLILSEIAKEEKLTPTDEEIDVELIRLMSQVKDADEERARSYLYQALSNEKVLKFLEDKGKDVESKES